MRDRRRALGLRERLEVEDAIDTAFAPLLRERTALSPLRVRAAVRWGRAEPPRALRWSGAIARLSELSLAVGMSVVMFAAALVPAEPAHRPDVDLSSAGGSQTDIVAGRPVSEDEQLVRLVRFDRAPRVAVVLQGLVSPQDRLDPAALRPSFPARLDPPAPRSTASTRGPY